MAWLLAGIALWFGGHLFKRLAPGLRARMGLAGKAAIALVLIVAWISMSRGYGAARGIVLHAPLPGMGYLNNLLMLVAFYLLPMRITRPFPVRRIRHPMLLAVVLWALAHLLVNGDLAALILFGAMLVWALLEMAVINRAEGPWRDRPQGSLGGEALNIALAGAAFGAVAWFHAAAGANPFAGFPP